MTTRAPTKRYDKKAKAAGKPTLLELAKTHSVGRTEASVNQEALVKFAAMQARDPQRLQETLAIAMGKLSNDMKEK